MVESRCSGAEVQMCRVMSRFADVQRSRGAEVQRYRGTAVQRYSGTAVQLYRGTEVQRCNAEMQRDAERCREVQEVQRCRGAEVVLKRWCSWWCLRDGAQLVERSAKVQEVQRCRCCADVQMSRCALVQKCTNGADVHMCRQAEVQMS